MESPSAFAVRRMEPGAKYALSSSTVRVESRTSVLAPPITPATATARVGVGDHEHRVAERPALPVQGHHRLARPGPPDDDVAAREEVAVERVERVAQLPEHVVRHVDDVVDRAEAGGAQPLGEPAGRRSRP